MVVDLSVLIKIRGINNEDRWLLEFMVQIKRGRRKRFFEEIAGLFEICFKWCVGDDFNVAWNIVKSQTEIASHGA